MNGTQGPKGLVRSALVFVEYPQIYTKSEVKLERATVVSRAAMATSARKEMEVQMAKLRYRRALYYIVPPAADLIYQPEDKVLLWRENFENNRIGEWLETYTIMATDETKKLVYVCDSKVPQGHLTLRRLDHTFMRRT